MLLTSAFRDQGWTVRSVFPKEPDNPLFLKLCAEQKATVEMSDSVLHWNERHTLSAIAALRRFIRDDAPDVLNLVYGGYFISLKDVLAARLAGVPRCVATVHHAIEWDSANERKRRMTGMAGRLIDGVIVPSQGTRTTMLKAGVPERKITIIPPPVPLPRLRPSRQEARSRLGIAQDAFVLSTLARLGPTKGIQYLIEAAACLADPDHQLVVLIGGDGGQRRELESLAAQRLGGRARFLGHIPDTADLYAAADVYVLPSESEGFGLVYVEAAYHGVTSIGLRIGGVPDAIDDGKTGLLVQPHDLAALVNAIARLRGDPDLCRRLGRSAQERALERCAPATVVTRYISLLRGGLDPT